MSCEYKGILFVISSVGVERAGKATKSTKITIGTWKTTTKNSSDSMEDLRVAHDYGRDAGVLKVIQLDGAHTKFAKIRRIYRRRPRARVFENARNVQVRNEKLRLHPRRFEVVERT